jgi:hypothetical protein
MHCLLWRLLLLVEKAFVPSRCTKRAIRLERLLLVFLLLVLSAL